MYNMINRRTLLKGLLASTTLCTIPFIKQKSFNANNIIIPNPKNWDIIDYKNLGFKIGVSAGNELFKS